MATFLDMKNRIGRELIRTDLASDIGGAIVSAIAFHERRRYAFNEFRTTWATVLNQEYYPITGLVPAGVVDILDVDSLSVAVNSGQFYPLVETSWGSVEDISVNASLTGHPMEWAYYGGQFRFYPVPNGIFTVRMAYVGKLTPLLGDGDSNAWTNDAEEMIRMRAKADVMVNLLRDYDGASLATAREQEVMAQLMSEAATKTMSGRIRPTRF